MNWQPIYKYHGYKRKPDNCVFYYPEVKHESKSYLNLRELILAEPKFGDRNPTHFCKVGTPND